MPAPLPFSPKMPADLSLNARRELGSQKQNASETSFADNLQDLADESADSRSAARNAARSAARSAARDPQKESENTPSSSENTEQSVRAQNKAQEENSKTSKEDPLDEPKERFVDDNAMLLQLQSKKSLQALPKEEAEALNLNANSSAQTLKNKSAFELDKVLLKAGSAKNILSGLKDKTNRNTFLKEATEKGSKKNLEKGSLELKENATTLNSSATDPGGDSSKTTAKESSFSEQNSEGKSSGENKSTIANANSSSPNSTSLTQSTTTPTASAPKTGMPQALLEQVVNDSHLRLAVQKSSARINLPMADGSELALKLSIKSGGVDIKVVGENSELLLSKSAELRASLQAEGLDLRSLSKISDVADSALNADVNDEQDPQQSRRDSAESDDRQQVDEFRIAEDGTLLALPIEEQTGASRSDASASKILGDEEHGAQDVNSLTGRTPRRRVHIRA